MIGRQLMLSSLLICLHWLCDLTSKMNFTFRNKTWLPFWVLRCVWIGTLYAPLKTECHFTKLSIWFFFCKFDLCEIKSMTFDSICDRHSLVEKWNWNWISILRIARNSIYMRSTEGNRDQNSNRHYDIHLYLQSNITSDELIE